MKKYKWKNFTFQLLLLYYYIIQTLAKLCSFYKAFLSNSWRSPIHGEFGSLGVAVTAVLVQLFHKHAHTQERTNKQKELLAEIFRQPAYTENLCN